MSKDEEDPHEVLGSEQDKNSNSKCRKNNRSKTVHCHKLMKRNFKMLNKKSNTHLSFPWMSKVLNNLEITKVSKMLIKPTYSNMITQYFSNNNRIMGNLFSEPKT